MDVIARLPGCAGQAADAVPAYTQVKIEVTAAKVMDIISRLPGCSGQASDAVSAYSCINVIENSKVRMPRYLDRSSTTQVAKFMVQH